MKPFKTILKNEIILSLRDMNMIIFAICTPIVVMILLGIFYGAKPAFEGAAYTFLEQSFGAVTTIGICAGGVMGLPLVVSDYRCKKILKRFKVTPVSPIMILAAQLAVYALYSFVSLLLVYLTANIFFGFRLSGSWFHFLGAYCLVMISIFSIGMMVCAIASNCKIASVIACVLYFPMLIFSGATLPYEVMPIALQKVSDFLPLSQGIKLLKAASLGMPMGSVLLPIVVMLALAGLCTGISIKFFRWE